MGAFNCNCRTSCLIVFAALILWAPTARAGDDTKRFYGTWKATVTANGQTITIISVHDASGYRNIVRMPTGNAPVDGTFNAADGKWSSNAPYPNNGGTYRFQDNDHVIATNAAGQTVTWVRDKTAGVAAKAMTSVDDNTASKKDAGYVAPSGLSDSYYPGKFPASYKATLEGARKLWMKDAVVVHVEVEGAFGIPTAWFRFSLYSPSTGNFATYAVGGPMNGQSTFSFIQPINRPRLGDPLPADLSVDLPDAIASLRKAGYHGGLGVIRLDMSGATSTTPLPAWSIRVGGKSPAFPPVFVNAQTGKFIPVNRMMDPAPGSDAELKEIWDRLLNRNQPAAKIPGQLEGWECVALIQEGAAVC
jgi:hypothetical protein